MKLNYNPFENFSNLGKIKSDSLTYQYNEDGQDALEEPIQKPNLVFIYLVTFIASFVLVFRLLDLQVAQGAKHEYLAEGNRIRSRDITASRGNIYDSNGNILTKNIASFNLELYPADLPKDKNQRESLYEKIKDISEIPVEELKEKIDNVGLFSLEPIILKENIDRNEALLFEVRFKDISAVVVEKHPARSYEIVDGLAHILGYIGKVTQEELDENSNLKITSKVGKSGIELVYDEYLRGEDGKKQVEVDSYGQIQRVLATLEPNPGDNLHLSLNLDLQKKSQEFLKNKMNELENVDKGVVIAMNPQNGQILSLVNVPSYDNNIFSSRDRNDEYKKLLEDENRPMLNRAISGIYPSGSVIKPVVAAAGLQEGVISENTTIYAPAEIKIGQWSFPDWKEHGYVDVRRALAVSSNVFFYSVGGGYEKISGLGLVKLKEYMEKFGYGSLTQIDLTSEAAGLIPDEDWKKKVKNEPWYIGDTYHLSIGQGDFLSTPLQVLNSISAIANGGDLLVPHVVSKITNSNGEVVKDIQREVLRERFIDEKNIKVVQEGMRQAVLDGSARQLQELPVSSAGKTGTAQTLNNEQIHSWFTAYAPYENPEIAIMVLVEHGGEGNKVAEPIANDILKHYFNEIKK